MTSVLVSEPAVVLVCMPWATAAHPSLPVSLLQARLEAAHVPTRALYASLWMADAIGADRYERYGFFDSVFSQFVFSELLFAEHQPKTLQFVEFLTTRGVSAAQIEELQRVLRLVPALVDWCLREVDWSHVRVVGFTTTFMQTMPSLALARVLRERYPDLTIVMGGAGCHGQMGQAVHRNFPFVDGVCLGEGDDAIVPMVKAALAGQSPHVSGVLWRNRTGQTWDGGSAAPFDMRDYRSPEFRDYFTDRHRFTGLGGGSVAVPFEASRGCWWGEIKHCRFCGLNGELMQQRVRPPKDVASELRHATQRYGAALFLAADNILAREHLEALPPQLREQVPGAELFFEVRVTMQRHQLAALADAGVRYMQPGIESLIAEVLRLMEKGTTPLLNLTFLRRAREFGILVDWNLMYGLPGEDAAWYDRLIERLPLYFHLPPPDLVRFGLQRFSPFFQRPSEFGIDVTGPLPGSEYAWRLPPSEIMALTFEWAFTAPGVIDDAMMLRLQSAVAAWRASHAILTADVTSSGCVVVRDTRPTAVQEFCVLSRRCSFVLRALERPAGMHNAAALLQPLGINAAELADAIGWLLERGFVHQEGALCGALVVPRDRRFWFEQPATPVHHVETIRATASQ